MNDPVFNDWLKHQYAEGMEFSTRSNVVDLAPIDGDPPFKYILRLQCRGLAQTDEGVHVVDRHLVGIRFPEDYLRVSCEPGRLLTWLEPSNEFHPNIRPPFCCIGHIAPGMGLVSLMQQLYSMVTWQRFTPREDDALNSAACVWARHNIDNLPVDRRRSMIRTENNVQP